MTSIRGMGRIEVTRSSIGKSINSGKIDVWIFKHLCIYDKATELIVQESKLLGHPVNVIDVGCGELWPIRLLWSSIRQRKSELISSYIGYDVDTKLTFPVNTDGHELIHFEIINQDLEAVQKLRQKDNSVEVVLSSQFIEHISEQAQLKLLKEIYRVSSKGGLFYLTTLNGGIKPPKDFHIYEPPLDDMLKTLNKVGWKDIQVHGMTIGMTTIRKAIAEHPERMSIEFYNQIKDKFSNSMARIILATQFPEYSDNVTYICRKEE